MKSTSSQISGALNIGICGLGTVGRGTVELLLNNAKEVERRLGYALTISHAVTRTLDVNRKTLLGSCGEIQVGTDPFAVVKDPQVQIVVEAMGGYDPAFEVVKHCLLYTSPSPRDATLSRMPASG